MIRIFRDIVVPIIVLGGGAGITALLFKTAPSEAEADIEASATAVEVATVQSVTEVARIHTTGRVEPDRIVTILPEVNGRLVSLSPELVPGGRFLENQEIGRIDPKDYVIGLLSEQSRVNKAELDLALETQRGSAAEREWELVRPSEDDNSLALRQPHRVAAESALESAIGSRTQAQHNVDRTYLFAPFNAVVLEESAEVGQVVGPGSPIATLVGTDHFRVRTSIPVEQLSLFELPGAQAHISQEVGLDRIERTGTVDRLSSQLDSSSQTAQVWIRVADPLDHPDGQLPLLAGSFVSVEIKGKPQEVRVVPRTALYDGHYTWVVDEGELRKADLEIAWSDNDNVYVTQGVNEGDRLVVSPISAPLKGMKVEVIDR
jgi:RND family efflux transporter MFP subunit